MAPSLTRDIDELVARHLPSGAVTVISDARTSTVLGDQVFRALKGRFDAGHILLPLYVQADEVALSEIEAKSSRADLLVAVGSGTINDLVKLAAHKANKPYIIFPTAASMNGYVSRNASISMHGNKQSLAAQLPLAVLMDMQVICAAPTRLAQAGLGDSLARPTAQADWLLSHHILGTDYDKVPYQLIPAHEEAVFEQAGGILHADREVMEALMKLLLLSGFGMSIAGSSTPASGAEHMIAHAYSMGIEKPDKENLHGEEIAFTTLTCAARQAQLIELAKPPRLMPTVWDKNLDQYFDVQTLASFRPLYDKKSAAINAHFMDGELNLDVWERARSAMGSIHIPPARLQKIAAQAALPNSPAKLGWNENRYAAMCTAARYTRDRFTCLDVA
jgi:glycerol-1-phosphate dehydrogenase [NAD(P)+]